MGDNEFVSRFDEIGEMDGRPPDGTPLILRRRVTIGGSHRVATEGDEDSHSQSTSGALAPSPANSA
ncbi:hypothetical protein BAU01nite_29930 [Brevibacterium aurantiacum]|nr:hypothetical protein BAU01nite_29930 [Brevibacterium aurantiacum]